MGEIHRSELEQVQYGRDVYMYFTFPLSHITLAMTLIVAVVMA